MILSYYHIIILLYYNIIILLYYNIIIVLYYYIIILLYYYIIILLYYCRRRRLPDERNPANNQQPSKQNLPRDGVGSYISCQQSTQDETVKRNSPKKWKFAFVNIGSSSACLDAKLTRCSQFSNS